MSKRNKLNWVRGILFICISVLLLVGLSKVLERKTINGSWNYTAKMNEFYAMPENSINIVGLGSSHMYSTINPLEIWNQNRTTAFLVATQRQPLNASYYYLKEVFKTQSPKVVIVEGYMGFEEEQHTEEAVAYDATDPLPLSLNKINLINEIVPFENRKNYYFNILKYHSRWRDLEQRDFDPSYWNKEDYFKGHVYLEASQDVKISEQNYDMVEAQPIPEIPSNALEDIYELTVKNDAELILLIAPYVQDDNELSGVMKSERIWAEDKGIDVIDINTMYDELNIQGDTDFYDASHLNSLGAKKFSLYLGDYIEEKYGLDTNSNTDSSEWDQDYNLYQSRFKELEK